MKTILSLAGIGLASGMAFAGWIRNPEVAPSPERVTYEQPRVQEAAGGVSYDRGHEQYRSDDRDHDRDDRYRSDDRYGDRDDRTRNNDRYRAEREHFSDRDDYGRR